MCLFPFVCWFLLVCAFGRAVRFPLFLCSLSLSCCLFGSLGSRPGPGGYTLGHFSLRVRLVRLNCLCLPPCVVVIVPGNRSPAGWFVSSRAPHATRCAVFIGLGNSSRLMDAIWCVSVRVRSRLPCLGFTFGFLGFGHALSVFGRGGFVVDVFIVSVLLLGITVWERNRE